MPFRFRTNFVEQKFSVSAGIVTKKRFFPGSFLFEGESEKRGRERSLPKVPKKFNMHHKNIPSRFVLNEIIQKILLIHAILLNEFFFLDEESDTPGTLVDWYTWLVSPL